MMYSCIRIPAFFTNLVSRICRLHIRVFSSLASEISLRINSFFPFVKIYFNFRGKNLPFYRKVNLIVEPEQFFATKKFPKFFPLYPFSTIRPPSNQIHILFRGQKQIVGLQGFQECFKCGSKKHILGKPSLYFREYSIVNGNISVRHYLLQNVMLFTYQTTSFPATISGSSAKCSSKSMLSKVVALRPNSTPFSSFEIRKLSGQFILVHVQILSGDSSAIKATPLPSFLMILKILFFQHFVPAASEQNVIADRGGNFFLSATGIPCRADTAALLPLIDLFLINNTRLDRSKPNQSIIFKGFSQTKLICKLM